MKAIYHGFLAIVTECQPNPYAPSDPIEVQRSLGATADELAALATDPTGIEITRDLWDADGAVLDGEVWISFLDPALIVDPTDDQVEAARR
jgi:hypothetical protein